MTELHSELENARNLSDVFELVKEAVRKTTGRSRAGLMLGLSEMGAGERGFVGAYYPVDSNIIVVNRTILERLAENNPKLYNPYAFNILLHEYLHSLGLLDEQLTRQKTYEITKKMLGEEHPATEIALDLGRIIPDVVYPEAGWQPDGFAPVELVKDFARSDTRYIS
jgi:predicted Zn-dependent protease with MMP-like domain